MQRDPGWAPAGWRVPAGAELDRRYAFIVNPAAGRGRAMRVWAALERRLRERGVDHRVAFTARPGHATDLARAAAGDGAAVVAVGGDGTGNEVAAALIGTGTPFGVVPAGTGNDFCRSAGVGTRPQEALERILAARPRAIDVGWAGRRPFINVAGAGFDAEVAAEVARLGTRLRGTIPYLYGVLKVLWRFRPVAFRCEVDGRVMEGQALLLAVANGRAYGGGMRIAPGAELDDGYLDVVVAGDLGRAETLLAFPRLYRGTHLDLPKVRWFRAREVHIETRPPTPFHADGEVLGRLPARFACQPRALSLLAPPP